MIEINEQTTTKVGYPKIVNIATQILETFVNEYTLQTFCFAEVKIIVVIKLLQFSKMIFVVVEKNVKWTERKESMTNLEVLQKAIDTYGKNMQEDICIEEMSELAKAIIKNRRNENMAASGRINRIREEIADVQIMLDQMRLIYGNTSEIEQYKLDRLAKRLER